MTEPDRASGRSSVLVVGLGSLDRGDDAVGPVVAARVGSAGDSIQDRGRFGAGNLDGVGIRGANLDAIGEGAAGGVRPVEIATLADPTALIDLMTGRDLVVVVDAVRSGAAPGTLHVRAAGADDPPLPTSLRSGSTSTHGFGLTEALALARTLGVLPDRLVVVGVEAQGFEPGAPPSPAVAAAVPAAVAAVLDLISAAGCPSLVFLGSRERSERPEDPGTTSAEDAAGPGDECGIPGSASGPARGERPTGPARTPQPAE